MCVCPSWMSVADVVDVVDVAVGARPAAAEAVVVPDDPNPSLEAGTDEGTPPPLTPEPRPPTPLATPPSRSPPPPPPPLPTFCDCDLVFVFSI